jgi:hypothetical protein
MIITLCLCVAAKVGITLKRRSVIPSPVFFVDVMLSELLKLMFHEYLVQRTQRYDFIQEELFELSMVFIMYHDGLVAQNTDLTFSCGYDSGLCLSSTGSWIMGRVDQVMIGRNGPIRK